MLVPSYAGADRSNNIPGENSEPGRRTEKITNIGGRKNSIISKSGRV